MKQCPPSWSWSGFKWSNSFNSRSANISGRIVPHSFGGCLIANFRGKWFPVDFLNRLLKLFFVRATTMLDGHLGSNSFRLHPAVGRVTAKLIAVWLLFIPINQITNEIHFLLCCRHLHLFARPSSNVPRQFFWVPFWRQLIWPCRLADPTNVYLKVNLLSK